MVACFQRSCFLSAPLAHVFPVTAEPCLLSRRSFCSRGISFTCCLFSWGFVRPDTYQIVQFVADPCDGCGPHPGVALLLSKIARSVRPKHCTAHFPLQHLVVGHRKLPLCEIHWQGGGARWLGHEAVLAEITTPSLRRTFLEREFEYKRSKTNIHLTFTSR